MHSAVDPSAAKAVNNRRPQLEVADIFRAYGPAYRRDHPLPLEHLKVMRAIETCRTQALGGHVERCDQCGFERISYNSCRNRHCPKCQAMAKAQWLQDRKAELLPVGYFHITFTVPHELNPVAWCNKKIIFDSLFNTVHETLKEFAADPRHRLGGRLGMTAILHTWNQKLLDHIHLHCVVPGGVLSYNGESWVHANENFLFNVKALSRLFRVKFIDALKKAYSDGQLIFPGKTAAFATKHGFAELINQLWKKEWVVCSKKPFAGPEKVLDYLGRYTHRIAIANHRIISIENSMVTFTYRDRRDNNKVKHLAITVEKFIRRFLLHVVPPSYIRIRHFGFLANKCKKKYLPLCRKALNAEPAPPKPEKLNARTMLLSLTGLDLDQCPHCKRGTMHLIMELTQIPP